MDDLADLTTTWHLHPTTTATCDDGSLCSELDKLVGARTNTHYILGIIYELPETSCIYRRPRIPSTGYLDPVGTLLEYPDICMHMHCQVHARWDTWTEIYGEQADGG